MGLIIGVDATGIFVDEGVTVELSTDVSIGGNLLVVDRALTGVVGYKDVACSAVGPPGLPGPVLRPGPAPVEGKVVWYDVVLIFGVGVLIAPPETLFC